MMTEFSFLGGVSL